MREIRHGRALSWLVSPLWLLAGFALFFPSLATAEISGSAHDFSSQGWSMGRICAVCHTPHKADLNIQAPLWNHEVTAVEDYTMYDEAWSSTIDLAVAAQPQGVSKACLSCHDGTVAIDSFAGNMGSQFIDGSVVIDTDLRGTHPISITYDENVAPGFHDLVTVSDLGLQFYGASGDQLECATCHNPHDPTNESFLRVSNNNSNLCLTCHDL